ncbi:2-aminoethylphosphonate--pyruvate transaminase [Salidesulfovibrio brasiliensis]|uniref:2-aminoethylphosphonate--pyruvate transaminase n=1 Tax=Salidesulfovibrio brasiliensis TaxID=221711 RepID=UPI001FE09B23|nr:2-aminoethylphosphonate--pyruvate transaminase [Salidesulfovibrio brasiliensis]
MNTLPDNPYVLLTPGPLSTSKGVKAVMLRDWCTWDDDYNGIVQQIRARLVELAGGGDYTAVLMQGSGTFSVEATVGTVVPADGKLLVVANGHYGDRIAKIAERLRMNHALLDLGEVGRAEPAAVGEALDADPAITHVAVVHCETTTGMLNPVREIGAEVKRRGLTYIIDAMSSFGGIPMNLDELGCDYLVSSANKCIQGVPGFGFVVARRAELEKCEGNARSLSLDLYHQWHEMEHKNGKWRYTSPTHVVRAFAQALGELEEEGGVEARFRRYTDNHRTLVDGMRKLGFSCLLPDEWQSPVITSFMNPDHPEYDFRRFYGELKSRGWVIYPGKVTSADTFRIGNIGDVTPQGMGELIHAVGESMYWNHKE